VILAIETSGAQVGVALADGETPVASCTVHARAGHDALLVPLISRLLDMVGIDAAAIEAVAVSEGPGSFTGLRIGMAAAKGFVLGRDIPLVCVGTFDAMTVMAMRTSALDGGAAFAPAFDARDEDVFAALYGYVDVAATVAAPPGVPEALLPAACVAAAEFAAALPAGTLLAGSGAEKIAAIRPGAFRVHPSPELLVSAGAVALLGARLLAAGRTADAATCEPRYLRAFQARRARPLFA
jgi:tRNA threonylcarbamoyladenosine biosynthesis protein TsaB